MPWCSLCGRVSDHSSLVLDFGSQFNHDTARIIVSALLFFNPTTPTVTCTCQVVHSSQDWEPTATFCPKTANPDQPLAFPANQKSTKILFGMHILMPQLMIKHVQTLSLSCFFFLPYQWLGGEH